MESGQFRDALRGMLNGYRVESIIKGLDLVIYTYMEYPNGEIVGIESVVPLRKLSLSVARAVSSALAHSFKIYTFGTYFGEDVPQFIC